MMNQVLAPDDSVICVGGEPRTWSTIWMFGPWKFPGSGESMHMGSGLEFGQLLGLR